jgi:hypothetical protein
LSNAEWHELAEFEQEAAEIMEGWQDQDRIMNRAVNLAWTPKTLGCRIGSFLAARAM